MKQKRLQLLLALLLTAVTGAWADELTVYDGTAKSYYIPYIFYWDESSKSQYLIPANKLSDMANGTISAITLYTPTSDDDNNEYKFPLTTKSEADVYLMEVNYSYFSSPWTFASKNQATIVYSGKLTFVSATGGGKVTISFTTPFAYSGDNLLIGFENTTTTGFDRMVFYGQDNFYGQDEYEKGPSLYCSGNGVVNPKYFKPKTTFTYTPGSGCSIPKLTVDNISHNGATLKVADGSGTYNVEYALASSETWQSVAQNSNQATFNLTGLSSQTDYKVRVQSACGSEWREAYFTTAVEAPSVGDSWSDDFEGSTCGWNLVNGSLTNAWAWGTAAKHGGTKGLYISNDGGTSNAYTNSYTMVYATKLLYFAEGKYQFSYNWRANGENAFDYLRVALVPASKTLTASEDIPNGFTVSTLPEGWMTLDGGRALNEKSEWQRKEAVANVSGTYYLVFAWRNDNDNQDNADKNPPAAIDNVSITKITSQLEAEGLTVDNSTITQTGATATWTGNAEQWQVSYATDANFMDATETIVSTKSYAMTNLQPGTLYYVRVRAYSSGYGTWCEALSFKTAPGPITSFPWTENFNGLTEDLSIPEFWDNSEGTTDVAKRKWCYKEVSDGPTVNSGHNGTKCIRFDSYYNTNGKTNFLKTPPLTFPADKDMRLKFWYKNPTGGDFSVYITTDDGTTALATGLTGKDEWTEMRIPLTDYVGAQNVVIVFKGTSNYADGDAYIYLDDVTVEYTPRLLTLEASPTNGGTVEVLNGIDDGVTDNGDGTYDVVPGTSVTLKATAADGYQLNGWSENATADTDDNTVATITVDATATATAYFGEKEYEVDLTVNGDDDQGTEKAKWTGKAGEQGTANSFPITAKTGQAVTISYNGRRKVKSVKAVLVPTYLKWDATKKKWVEADIPANATTLKNADSGVEWEAGTYLVEGNVTINGTVTLKGDVELIIKDGAKLNANQIKGDNNHSLNIYGQADKSGELNVACSYGDAILKLSVLNIHNCKVNASSSSSNAWCGGFYLIGELNLYGGSVDATGSNTGYGLCDISSLNIWGGEMKAEGTGDDIDYSYGIACWNRTTNVTVYGGKLWVKSADSQALDLNDNVTFTKADSYDGKIETSDDGENWTVYNGSDKPNTKYVRVGY